LVVATAEALMEVPIDDQIFSSPHAWALIGAVRSLLEHGSLSVRLAIYVGLALGVVLYFLVCRGCSRLMTSRGRSGVLGFVLPLVLGLIGVFIILIIVLASPRPDSYRLRVVSSSEPLPGGLGYSRGASARLGSQPTSMSVIGEKDTQTCSFCYSRIPLDAVICRVCQVDVVPTKSA
jgi:hypothetical protein